MRGWGAIGALFLVVVWGSAQVTPTPQEYPFLVRVNSVQARGNQSLILGVTMDTRTKEKRTIRWLCNGVIEIGKDARLLAARQDHEHIYTLAVNRLGTKKYEDVGCTEV